MAEEKVPYHHHSHSNIFLLLLIVILLGMFGSFMIFKHVMLKRAMYQYVGQARTYGAMEDRTSSTIEEANIFATTIAMTTEKKSLLSSKDGLESYVMVISKQTNRDIVVTDRTGKILADSVTKNIGSTYVEARSGELVATIADGTPRTFTETSIDYPDGLNQIVVPIKDSSTSAILGTVVMSAWMIK